MIATKPSINYQRLAEDVLLSTHRKSKEPVVKKGDESTPRLRWLPAHHILWLSGTLDRPADSDWMLDLIHLIDQHFERKDCIQITLDLPGLSQRGRLAMMHLMHHLKKYLRKNKEILVTWMVSHQDDDQFEFAYEIADLYGVKLKLRTY